MAGFAAVVSLPAQVPREYQIKAAFLYNFTKFVEWPPARFADETSPIVIGVLGRNPFDGELEKIVKDRTVNGRAIGVKLIRSADDLPGTHVVFVPAGEEELPAFAAALAPRLHVLTVGESDRFVSLGGAIRFAPQADKVRFAINLEPVELSGLKISSQLLKLATEVRRKP